MQRRLIQVSRNQVNERGQCPCHRAGNHTRAGGVLRCVAKTMESSIREVDRAFRIGGEEFAVILTDTDIPGAQLVAERLRAAIATAPVTTESGQVSVTTSIGIARARKAMEPAELLKAADAALYEAKANGRNRVVVAHQYADSLDSTHGQSV
jgi:diguanylate cyclase (GGDEF)-like protein